MRRTLRCINAPCLLPALPAPPPGLQLRLKVVRPARLISAAAAHDPAAAAQEQCPKAVGAPY
ncbi:MAG: hypothetical protein ACK6BU_13025, partial [Cyanobacteriota bacterium]